MYSVFDSISWHGDRKAETSLYSIERKGVGNGGGGEREDSEMGVGGRKCGCCHNRNLN